LIHRHTRGGLLPRLARGEAWIRDVSEEAVGRDATSGFALECVGELSADGSRGGEGLGATIGDAEHGVVMLELDEAAAAQASLNKARLLDESGQSSDYPWIADVRRTECVDARLGAG
jgi:hypothetical protein